VPGEWTPEPFEADDGTIPFERFINGLSDFQFVALDTAIDRVLLVRGIELVRTEWLKALGDGLHEFRVRHDASEIAHMFGGDTPAVAGPSGHVLLRVFVHFHGDKVPRRPGPTSSPSRQRSTFASCPCEAPFVDPASPDPIPPCR
jgi:hypothetical protein